jgi:hypothetical protein
MPTFSRSLDAMPSSYAPYDPSEPLDGLVLTNGITNDSIYFMVEIFITIPEIRGSNIISAQNGLSLKEDIHTLFDTYGFSIMPHVGRLPYL